MQMLDPEIVMIFVPLELDRDGFSVGNLIVPGPSQLDTAGALFDAVLVVFVQHVVFFLGEERLPINVVFFITPSETGIHPSVLIQQPGIVQSLLFRRLHCLSERDALGNVTLARSVATAWRKK